MLVTPDFVRLTRLSTILNLINNFWPGQEQPAIIDDANEIRDLSGVVRDIDGAAARRVVQGYSLLKERK